MICQKPLNIFVCTSVLSILFVTYYRQSYK